ncbi:hypothetical protein QBC36DRAFT_331222 [Triangularia setosa]|uniref:Uncharacterized protein n=1 Tax=Triangularia setosa TaxID=2587417 RepID=A0AAN6W548_9PEZI|nr:hypothetical protein QBC36DRAFT_331222 [Podospora setosa]
MVPHFWKGTFTPNPASQPLHTGLAHAQSPSHHGAPSAGASPSTSSPTGSSSLTKIAVAQVLLLLSTIKEDKDDPRRWKSQTDSLRKVRCQSPFMPLSALCPLLPRYQTATPQTYLCILLTEC